MVVEEIGDQSAIFHIPDGPDLTEPENSVDDHCMISSLLHEMPIQLLEIANNGLHFEHLQ